jgi:hypothetical protein
MAYIHFTDEQKQRAASVNLEEFLRLQGERLITSGHEKRLDSDHSVTVRGNRWYDHATQEGGGPVSFARRRYNLSYPEAVTMLLNGESSAMLVQTELAQRENKRFELPNKHSDMRRVYAYLMNRRFIAREIIAEFARNGLLYESSERLRDGSKEFHNAVFVGFDEDGEARHAHKHGLYSEGKAYKGNVLSSTPAYSFHYNGNSERLFVFEAPIDLLSFVTLYQRDWKQYSYVALCGVSEHAMLKQLELNPRLRNVTLCLDDDTAGIEATARLSGILRKQGYGDISVLQPRYKDWNEDLKAQNGFAALPAEEHPQLELCGEVFRRIASLCGQLPQSVNAVDKLPGLLETFSRRPTPELAEDIAVLALSAAVREYRQLGQNTTPGELAERLRYAFVPHSNRSVRVENIAMSVNKALASTNAVGIRSETQKREQAQAWLDAVQFCAGYLVQSQAEEMSAKQANTHPQMQL